MPDKINDRLLVWGRDGIEDNTLEQANLTAQLPFVHSHVALMPDAHVGIGATVGSVIATRGAIVPAAVGVDIGCFLGDTRVALLNGRQKTLREMTDAGGEWWVYSVDVDGQIVPGRAIALQTRKDAPLMRVVVSGGEEIVCTPDHDFMLSNGSYREARELKVNDSLMPLYRKWQQRDGYESSSTGKGTSRLTYHRVYEATRGASPPEGSVIHHVDHHLFNNEPDNLQVKTMGDHSSHHAADAVHFDNSDPEFQERRMAGIARRVADPEKRAQMVETATRNITKYMTERPEEFKEAVAGNGKRGAPFLTAFNTSPRACADCGFVAENPSALQWHKKREHIPVASNHKVIAIEPVEFTADVFCLQVEEHHNFALAAGVFVHNCGMIACPTNLTSHDLPESLDPLHGMIAEAIPAGVGKGQKTRPIFAEGEYPAFFDRDEQPVQVQKSNSLWDRTVSQFGTLGSGNHFVEVCLDQDDKVWVVLHSGSRGVGNEIAKRHIEGAKKLMKRYFIELEDPDLAYFAEHTREFDEYIHDMLWAQEYAAGSRERMMTAALLAVESFTGHPNVWAGPSINCHHNYTEQERHHGQDLWVTRKGAIRAREGDRGVIPGSMATGTYIVEGLGNPASFTSASHGAGRRMSRGVARRTVTEDELREAMAGKAWNSSDAKTLLDEAPAAYKPIEDVMAAQADLVRVTHSLTQILNYKGTN